MKLKSQNRLIHADVKSYIHVTAEFTRSIEAAPRLYIYTVHYTNPDFFYRYLAAMLAMPLNGATPMLPTHASARPRVAHAPALPTGDRTSEGTRLWGSP